MTYPLDVLRIRLALLPNSTWISTIRQGGLFQGITPTLLGIIPYSGTSWMMKQYLHEVYFLFLNKSHATVIESLVINAIAGLVGQFVTYPLDIARRRLQMFKPIVDEHGKPTKIPSVM